MIAPTKNDIVKAYSIVKQYAHCTPVLTSQSVSKILGCNAYFKCENFQKVGAFKFRGASNAVFSLSEDLAQKGVCTHSSGNHAAALALAASMRGIPAYIVMPENAPAIKRKAVEGYGAKIFTCESTQEARERELKKVQADTGATFIHPYENFHVICGQGTASLELLQEVTDLQAIITPVGGGGLFSGTLIYTKETNPKIEVYAGEPQNADDAFRSLRDGVLYPSVQPNTIADGLRTSLCPLTLSVIQRYANGILTVSEEAIVEAMRLVWERMKIIIEPSSAVPVATIMQNRGVFEGKKVGIIISGGNVDVEKLPF
ncbi:pyridoxal-phosphate dependent enzyme [Perlabentimonas gracilis]|uniref:pyridoxal-phosphate dependent enzyme n=1 Tax=Perlabentimonas gracilis TaxID=2715279 RepID=UPI00140B081D|nr:pyridoxal-phosphate dependent enzyme [Perlabentimonas gracilis]NHB69373.1 pyridoxal-phosphate dependent enzyme [Perlabentimonas gracilis]